jgi:hypothetical protein
MAVDFSALLSKPLDEVKAPVPLPAGTYYGIIKEYKFDESPEKKTPFIRFTIQLTGAGDDVYVEEVASIEWSKKQLRKDFYLTEDALFRFKKFLETLGIDTVGKSFDSLIPETQGAKVLVEVTQRPNTRNPEEPPFNDIKNIAGHEQ